MKIPKIFKTLVKLSFNILGYDIIRLNNNPKATICGLKKYPIRTIIDVGANEGQFARYISKIFPEAILYCFEPVPETFEKLKNWAVKNGNINAFNIALGDFNGDIEMLQHTEHSPSSSILKTSEICESLYPFTKKQKTINVRQMTMDNAIQSLNMTLKPDVLIKLDVQGYEDRVIRGGEEIFRNAKACILEICLDELYKEQANFREIIELLYNLGFNYAGNLD
ncbi:MAG: FkbM family methyltransferase [Sulfolobaceae archaeon]